MSEVFPRSLPEDWTPGEVLDPTDELLQNFEKADADIAANDQPSIGFEDLTV